MQGFHFSIRNHTNNLYSSMHPNKHFRLLAGHRFVYNLHFILFVWILVQLNLLFLRETIFFIICFFHLFLPYFIPINVYFVFLLSCEENYCFWYGAFTPSKAISAITNAVMSLTIIQQILSHKNQFLFPSVFLPRCPNSRFFFCKRSFFRAKNLRRFYSSFTKASAFRTKRSFFRTKSRFSFCSSLPFETHRIYSHLLQTKFLSRKK